MNYETPGQQTVLLLDGDGWTIAREVLGVGERYRATCKKCGEMGLVAARVRADRLWKPKDLAKSEAHAVPVCAKCLYGIRRLLWPHVDEAEEPGLVYKELQKEGPRWVWR